jgi:hypothetical protein
MVTDNSAASTESMSFSSEGAAQEWMAGAVAADRGLAGQLHVVPQFELVSS